MNLINDDLNYFNIFLNNKLVEESLDDAINGHNRMEAILQNKLKNAPSTSREYIKNQLKLIQEKRNSLTKTQNERNKKVQEALNNAQQQQQQVVQQPQQQQQQQTPVYDPNDPNHQEIIRQHHQMRMAYARSMKGQQNQVQEDENEEVLKLKLRSLNNFRRISADHSERAQMNSGQMKRISSQKMKLQSKIDTRRFK